MDSESKGVAFVKKIVVLSFVAAAAFVWYVAFREDRGDILRVAFLDIGQGDAAFVETPRGNQMLIDFGPGSSVLAALGRELPFYDRTLDVVLATHPDADHVGGLPEVLERFDVGAVIVSPVSGDTELWKESERAIAVEGAAVVLARAGERIVLDEGIVFEVLFPDRDMYGSDTNQASIVGRLSYGEISFLFTGDAPKSVESYLADSWGAGLRSNVLKVGHHGSRTSTDARFLSAVAPAYAVISAGTNNRYGHPHREVVELFGEFGIETIGTYASGTVHMASDGFRVWLEKR